MSDQARDDLVAVIRRRFGPCVGLIDDNGDVQLTVSPEAAQALLALLDAEPVAWGAKMPPAFGGGIEVYRADTWDKLRAGVEELCIGKPFALYARPEASDE